MVWLKQEGIVPANSSFNRVFATYPLLDRNAIKGEHLASLAIEWDKDGPCNIFEWFDMIEFECSGSPKRDKIREQLEAVGGLHGRRSR